MPELPEVETIRTSLETLILNLAIEKIDLLEQQLRWRLSPKKIKKAQGHWIREIRRRGKYLLLCLEDGAGIVIHLGMSGRLSVISNPTEIARHDHVIFYFDNGLQLRYHDPRKFGMVDYVGPGALADYRHFRHLGPEPLTGQFSPEYFQKRAAGSGRPVKYFIMDSQVVVGVGNIYANEALFVAGLHPQRQTGELSRDELERLRQAIQSVLSTAVHVGGTTLKDSQYRNVNGEMGFFQLQLQVYDRMGEPCKQCATPIERLRMANRSSYFCPKCQPPAG